jgi:hypothetical protein
MIKEKVETVYSKKMGAKKTIKKIETTYVMNKHISPAWFSLTHVRYFTLQLMP